MTLLFDEKLYTAPLSKDIQNALDVGTGTGMSNRNASPPRRIEFLGSGPWRLDLGHFLNGLYLQVNRCFFECLLTQSSYRSLGDVSRKPLPFLELQMLAMKAVTNSFLHLQRFRRRVSELQSNRYRYLAYSAELGSS